MYIPDPEREQTKMREPSSTTATLAAPATYQDVVDAPEHVVAELIGSTLHTHPRPAPTPQC